MCVYKVNKILIFGLIHMNWYALLFGPYYYAGYGKLAKGVIMALIGSLPLTLILVNLYAAFRANKELPIGECEFNWKYALGTAVVGLLSTGLAFYLIQR